MRDFRDLLDKFLGEDMTAGELEAFLSACKDSSNYRLISQVLKEKLEQKTFTGLADQHSIDEMFAEIMEKAKVQEGNKSYPASPRVYFLRTYWYRYAAAILLILAVGYFISPSVQKKPIVSKSEQRIDDVLPGKTGAILTLSDGSSIVLDSAGKGIIVTEGNALVTLDKDRLIYVPGSKINTNTAFNTLTTPKGKQFHVELSDGTQVWLNAASSIRFPTVFSGDTRNVVITGEAFLEVAKNPAMPFKVHINQYTEIDVLGTHFNVNSYTDEPASKVTLLEGKVKVSSAINGKNVELLPGQQALVNIPGISILKNVDVEQAIAWKNGLFFFNGDDIKTIMRQVEKWYNVEVHYESEISHSFVAKISKYENVSNLLHILELTDLVHFDIKNNIITVKK